MSTYYLKVPLEDKQGYYTIEFSQGSPNYVGTLVFIETGGGGGGEPQIVLNYTNLVANLDGSYTATDTDGNTHLLVPTYENNVLTSITYDGKNVKLVYDDSGNLTSIGDSSVNVQNYSGKEEAETEQLIIDLSSLTTPSEV